MSSDFSIIFPPLANRMHEVCGPGALFFAIALAGQRRDRVLWVCESWKTEQINPLGFGEFLDPRNVIMARTKDQTEVLAVAEEALRSGAVGLVVMDISQPLGLTAGRRLQLAAKDGQSTGLAIIPQDMGSNAAETRWQCSPVFDPDDSTLHHWQLIKNKSGTLGAWNVRWDAKTRRILVVSPAGKRPGSQGAPD